MLPNIPTDSTYKLSTFLSLIIIVGIGYFMIPIARDGGKRVRTADSLQYFKRVNLLKVDKINHELDFLKGKIASEIDAKNKFQTRKIFDSLRIEKEIILGTIKMEHRQVSKFTGTTALFVWFMILASLTSIGFLVLFLRSYKAWSIHEGINLSKEKLAHKTMLLQNKILKRQLKLNKDSKTSSST